MTVWPRRFGHDGGGATPREMSRARARWRTLRFGLETVLGLRRRGWFAPNRFAAAPPAEPYCAAAIDALFAAERDAFRLRLRSLDAYRDIFSAFEADNPPEPRWDQDWFPRLDGAMAYAMTRAYRPARIVEAGSGHSTRFFARAVRDGGLQTEIVAIDPAPRARLPGSARRIPQPVQQAGPEPFAGLASGDILSIDSGHVLMPGSDVDFLLNAALPTLPSGALAHFHDFFMPDGYPASWEWRGYNEQFAVAPLLLQGGWRVLFASHYVATRMAEDVSQSAIGAHSLPAGALESSLWLQRL